jgi:hypothetical protein
MFLAVFASAVAFAQDGEPSLKLSGEAKSGIFYQQTQENGKEAEVDDIKIESHDGDPNGNRFRLNLDYDNGKNLGFRARLQWQEWNDAATKWAYAFGYGNFFNDTLAQMTISVGKLGGSPWGTGGDLWKELEFNDKGGGMRVEWKPAWPEEWGRLNLGFVLNSFNADQDRGTDNMTIKLTLAELIKESVIGVSYIHDDWFMVRLAYRFDSEADTSSQVEKTKEGGGKGEDEMLYRVEEYALRGIVPGLRLWALGHLYALSTPNKEIQYFNNQFYVEYDPPELFGLDTPFTAQFSVGNVSGTTPEGDMIAEVFIRPSFYWHISPGGYSKLISIGSIYKIAFDYGAGGIEGDHPYYYMELEPKLQINFQSSYIAFVYQFRQEYKHASLMPGIEPIVQRQWMNLRFGIYF